MEWYIPIVTGICIGIMALVLKLTFMRSVVFIIVTNIAIVGSAQGHL